MYRGFLAIWILMSVVACTARPFRPLEYAPPVSLQDALPGQAVVYLLRTPHDKDIVPVYFNGTKVAALPPESYTAVSLRPGTYAISSVATDASASSTSVNASVLTVAAGERRLLYTAVPTNRHTEVLFLPTGPGFGVVPLVLQTVDTGARFWRECTEQDAQGLLSISKAVMPEQNAL